MQEKETGAYFFQKNSLRLFAWKLLLKLRSMVVYNGKANVMVTKTQKKKKLHIALFHLAFLYSGGGERLVLEEALGLRKLGHMVDVYSPIIDTKHCFPELLKKVGVKHLIPKLPQWIPDVELIAILLACIITPLFFWKFRQYDIYVGANQPGPWIAYVLSKLNKKPYAVYLSQPTRLIHPRLIDQKTGLKIVDGVTILNVVNFFCKPLFNLVDVASITGTPLVFADGTYMKGVLEEVYDITTVNAPAATHLHPKITDALLHKRFKGVTHIGKYRIPRPFVLITNRHFPQKKFEYGMEALRLLSPLPVSLVISGKETTYTKFLKKQAGQHVYFVGLVNEKELTKLYKEAAVYLYPSPEEDFGMGILEAMSYGLPVVAWNNAGPTGIITHGEDGYLAQPFQVVDFANYVRKLLTDRKQYKHIIRNAYKTVEKRFSFLSHNRVIEAYLLRIGGLYDGRLTTTKKR